MNPRHDIFFYAVLDTNWLMNEPTTRFILPKVPVYSNPLLPWSQKEIIHYLLFCAELVMPLQVKRELAKLHIEKADHAKTANAKRNYASLQRFFDAEVVPSAIAPLQTVAAREYRKEEYDSFVRGAHLLTMREVDLDSIPMVQMQEKELGPDSDVDKGIISLAHKICGEHPMNHCFICSYDTGIQAEVSNLRFRKNMKIGCPAFIDEWMQLLDQSAMRLAKSGGGSG
jgi:hypothetical protein